MQPDIMSLHNECLIINQGKEVQLTLTVSIPHKSIVYFFHISFIEFYIKRKVFEQLPLIMYPVQIGYLFLEDKTKADILINESSIRQRFRRESDIRGWKKRKLICDCGFSESKITSNYIFDQHCPKNLPNAFPGRLPHI